MALKLNCPKCSTKNALTEPYPLPGDKIKCHSCSFSLTIAYPPQILKRLQEKGKQFRGEEPPPPEVSLPEPAIETVPESPEEPEESTSPQKNTRPLPPEKPAQEIEKEEEPPPAPKKKKSPSLLWRLFRFALVSSILLGIAGAITGWFVYDHYAQQVPSVETLREYSPPTVTVVYDRNNEVLAEIYKNRRYVTPISDIPKHVQNAFIAAEDANFHSHSGVDFMGIARAVIRNALKGKKAQGASTITQQVAKNFLLTSEKTYTRKIKEAILAQRIEETFDKGHILYLYLNEIYLGSSAYGVEAASRVYFDKHVQDITLAEAAILAGLPQRPSDYSPHSNWKKARNRQQYVLRQLLQKKFISQEEFDEASAEVVRITKKPNAFLKQAPYYTEHVRRYLVETYGSEKIYNDGLEVVTACDLNLQKEAQNALKNNVERADRSSGWRGANSLVGLGLYLGLENKKLKIKRIESGSPAETAGLKVGNVIIPPKERSLTPKRDIWNLLRKRQGKTAELTIKKGDSRISKSISVPKIDETSIKAWREGYDQKLRADAVANIWFVADPESPQAGPHKPLEKSKLNLKKRYEAVVTKVSKKYFMVGIGAHKAMIPNEWSRWSYAPNPLRSFKRRYNKDMTKAVNVGDIVTVEIAFNSLQDAIDDKETSKQDKRILKKYKKLESSQYFMAKLVQDSKLEGAILSYRMTNSTPETKDKGAVLAMVGGVDYSKSEYNRATQAIRQVGSTFKPIVYAAAIESKQFTAASILPDQPLTYATLNNKLWKPGNYGGEFLGNITLRQALMRSRNSCTILVLENLSWEKIYDLAGPRLGIGFSKPTCTRKHIPQTDTCDGIASPSPVEGMVWCEKCLPESCPLVNKDRAFIKSKSVPDNTFQCMADNITKEGSQWCRSCDVNLRVCAWIDIEELSPRDSCIDARIEKGKIKCRSCDMSMGLGSSSLTMVELARAYTAFGTYGTLIEPYFIERVLDRDGTVIEQHQAQEPKQVLDPSVAYITHWLLTQVATNGTAARSNRLKLSLAGKTGTTNDEIDAWFVGYNPDIIAAAWVGYDQPRPMGVSFTGGATALPVWMDFMKAAVPKDDPEKNRRFPTQAGIEWVNINETTGLRASDGVSMPMLPGTAPTNVVGSIGQKTSEDLLIDDY